MTYLDALQDALAAEYAAVHVLGYLGAQTSQSAQPDVYADLDRAYAAHRATRDLVTARVRDAGGTPVAALPGYRLPDLDGSAEALRAAAARVERTCTTAYPALVSADPGRRGPPVRRGPPGGRRPGRAHLRRPTPSVPRTLSARQNSQSANSFLRGTPEMLPGRDECADRCNYVAVRGDEGPDAPGPVGTGGLPTCTSLQQHGDTRPSPTIPTYLQCRNVHPALRLAARAAAFGRGGGLGGAVRGVPGSASLGSGAPSRGTGAARRRRPDLWSVVVRRRGQALLAPGRDPYARARPRHTVLLAVGGGVRFECGRVRPDHPILPLHGDGGPVCREGPGRGSPPGG